jgi:hypothetical protein
MSKFLCNQQRFENQYDVIIGKSDNGRLKAFTKNEADQFILYAKKNTYNFQSPAIVEKRSFKIDIFDPIRDGARPPVKCIIVPYSQEPPDHSHIGQVILFNEKEEPHGNLKFMFIPMGLFIH